MLLSNATPRQVNLGLLITRLAVGTIFIAHGAQKLFVWGPQGVAAGFDQMGVPMASIVGPFIGGLELFGGAALVLGLLTRVFSFGLAGTMLGAILLAHLPNGFFLPSGFEFVLALFGSTLLLTLTGAGEYSLDNVLAGRRAGGAVGSLPELKAQRVA